MRAGREENAENDFRTTVTERTKGLRLHHPGLQAEA